MRNSFMNFDKTELVSTKGTGIILIEVKIRNTTFLKIYGGAGWDEPPCFFESYMEEYIMMNEKENNIAMYGYIIYMFGKLAEEHEAVKEKLPELKKNIQKQLNVNVVSVAFDII